MAPVAVNEVIERMQTLLRHTIGRSVAIETRLDPQAGYGLCDANQLENAILNLAINARDAMPDGGTLTIATDRTATPDGDAPFLRITVHDTGQGMPPEILARATEPFFSTKPLGKGTGLGLAQVYGIVQQSGGTLRIDSLPGNGTTVEILLPVSEPGSGKMIAMADGAAAASAGPKARVLVVDDDADVRGFLAESLQDLGHEVRAAELGEQAIAELSEWRPDLALIDYAMPGMNGADTARAARALLPDLPIVFVTGYAESERLEAALGSAVPLLRKPFTLDELDAAVARNLRENVLP